MKTPIRVLVDACLGDDIRTLPDLPEGASPEASRLIGEGVARLVAFQNADYAGLYLDRLQRFAKRGDVDEPLLCEIARLLAIRMSYCDPIWLAQCKLAEHGSGLRDPDMIRSDVATEFDLADLVSLLPDSAASPAGKALQWLGQSNTVVVIPAGRSRFWKSVMLRGLASLRRLRPYSQRYRTERVWVERWLHMISRALAKKPDAAMRIAQMAATIGGSGAHYRTALANWNEIIDRLVKPALEGASPVRDLGGAIEEAEGLALAKSGPQQMAGPIDTVRSRQAR